MIVAQVTSVQGSNCFRCINCSPHSLFTSTRHNTPHHNTCRICVRSPVRRTPGWSGVRGTSASGALMRLALMQRPRPWGIHHRHRNRTCAEGGCKIRETTSGCVNLLLWESPGGNFMCTWVAFFASKRIACVKDLRCAGTCTQNNDCALSCLPKYTVVCASVVPVFTSMVDAGYFAFSQVTKQTGHQTQRGRLDVDHFRVEQT